MVLPLRGKGCAIKEKIFVLTFFDGEVPTAILLDGGGLMP